MGRGSCRVAPVPDEIPLRFGWVEPFARCKQGGPLAIEVDQLLGDSLTFRRVAMQEVRCAALTQNGSQLPAEIEAILHGNVHALARFRAVRVAGVAGDEHARQAFRGLLFRDVIELVAEALADLVDRPPRDLFHIERMRLKNAPRGRD